MELKEKVERLTNELIEQKASEELIERANDVYSEALEAERELQSVREEKQDEIDDLEKNIHDLEEKLADAMPSPRTITEREKYQVFERLFIQLGLDQLLELEREAERKFEYRTDFAAWPAMEKMKDEE